MNSKQVPTKNQKYKRRSKKLLRKQPPANTEQQFMNSLRNTPSSMGGIIPGGFGIPGNISADPQATVAWCHQNCKFASETEQSSE